MKAQVAGCLEALDHDANGVRARFRFDPDLPVFVGHFPGRPLVPAVFLLEAVRLACEGALGIPLRFSVKKAKFSGEVRPGDLVELDGDLTGEAPAWDCRADLRTERGDAARLVLRLRPEGA